MAEIGNSVETEVTLREERNAVKREVTNPTTQWNSEATNGLSENLKVLDPEDPLMKRFQDSLKAHLTRINNRLSEDILNLENDAKESKKKREAKAAQLYSLQEEIVRQQDVLSRYEKKLADLARAREDKESSIDETKQLRKLLKEELENEKNTTSKFNHEMESLTALNRHFDEWEKEMTNHMKVAKRMTEKEAIVQRDLLKRKQYEDYILTNLMEEISRLENEIKDCREQLEMKEREKLDAGQTVTDANTDLEGLQRTQKKLFSEWNRVLVSISQRDQVNEELVKEREKIRESFTTLGSQLETLKKVTKKEMETNERLTSIQTRLENEMRYNLMTIEDEKNKMDNVEGQLIDTSKLLEQMQSDFDTASWAFQRCVDEEKVLDKELEKLRCSKNELEDAILSRLEGKITHDKTTKLLNRNLREVRDKMREEELAMFQTENNYGRNILELEKLKSLVAAERCEVEDLTRINTDKEKEWDALQNEIKKCDSMITKKQQRIVGLNKKIEEIISTLASGEEINPRDLRIKELEKNIEKTETSNRVAQEVWLRQEGYMVTLSEERTDQLREIDLLGKQITIMEQKSLKLEREIEAQQKEEENICRTIKNLQQKLLVANERIAAQREVHDDLEDKNCIAKNECIETLRDAETELLKLQNDIRELNTDRRNLEEQLKDAQREALSWEKKVQLASETAKKLKEERCNGGDVALMKCEIHKMEMRLCHLRKTQEKMIRDMEFCVARRDVIVEGALAREKKNPKGLHNQRVVFEKRMNDQKLKIKQINKETKQMENQILELEGQQKILLEQLDENQRVRRAHEDDIPDIDKQITEAELVKCHKLECLVQKQRKVRLLQDVKEGRYKMHFRSELSLNDELHKQRTISSNLKEIMEEARRDFPLLKDSIRKILLSMEIS